MIECPKTRKETRYVVYNFNDQLEEIIPFFTKYSLLSTKLLDFHDFNIVSNILKNKILKEKDLLIIKEIKSNMNSKRKFFKK